jgi:beta-N-acetylhexosaminidase
VVRRGGSYRLRLAQMPNHLIDVPMVKTAINAHTPTAETVKSLVAKLIGRSEFTGTHNDNVSCGSWDTRR